MGFFDKIFRKNSEISWMYDLEFLQDVGQKAYVKQMALNTVVEFIARTISQSEFRVMKGNKTVKDDLYYLLNVKPNPNQNAVQFWQKFIYKIIIDNEALIIQSDDDYLYIADDFQHEDELGLLPHKFTDVFINDFKYDRYFNMDDVIYLQYSNEELERFSNGLFEDYGEIFGRMINLQLKKNQVRGILNVDATQLKGDNAQKQLQEYIDMVFEAFNKNQTAVVPLPKGLDYEEHSNKGANQNKSDFNELDDLKKSVLIDVARMIGVPPSLIIGEVADLEKTIKLFFETCGGPLVKKIQSELNGKMLYKDEYLDKEMRIKIVGIDKRDPLELSESIDKLKSSGNYTGNQIRIMVGDEPGDDPHLDEYVLTKNYEAVSDESIERGENE
ncbi:phage portal protein [Staphylococcus ureilyticus]|uniref:phage portal protein n=1 Tax=Staphylococcus ureilyticus TaxID=94138 RepID=UPI002902AB16|nr:phage portal protein [Staphylococcus ureilyticus]MDU0461933.1 phage portal protein [Staphylococcus ureilyticus]